MIVNIFSFRSENFFLEQPRGSSPTPLRATYTTEPKSMPPLGTGETPKTKKPLSKSMLKTRTMDAQPVTKGGFNWVYMPKGGGELED